MGFSIGHLLVVLLIVLVVFGTKRLRNVGGDLGAAIRNFKTAMNEGENEKKEEPQKLEGKGRVIEGEATHDKDKV